MVPGGAPRWSCPAVLAMTTASSSHEPIARMKCCAEVCDPAIESISPKKDLPRCYRAQGRYNRNDLRKRQNLPHEGVASRESRRRDGKTERRRDVSVLSVSPSLHLSV